jgi:ABC-type nitrate/sulfonate/bicarbonate transport system substrate-binding protein
LRRVLVGGGVSCALLFGLLGAPSESQDMIPITIASSQFDSSTAGYYAYKTGMFKKAGLDVTYMPMGSGAIAPAVIGGTVTFGGSNLFSVVEARAHGVPVVVIAPGATFDKTDEDGYVGFIVAKNSPIHSGKDLNGKTVGTPALKDFNALAVMAWIDQTGGDSSTVHFVELPASIGAASVVAGRVDATVLTVPYLKPAVDSGNVRVLTDAYSSIAKAFLGLGWIATQAYADAHPDVVARFSRVIHDADVYVNAHHEETVEMMAEYAKVDPSAIRGTTRVSFAPYVTAAMLQPVIDISARYHIIDKSFPAAEMISPSALQPPR